MSKNSGQKFLARNRSPRVQIEYDVEIYGVEKKIELPFRDGGVFRSRREIYTRTTRYE